MYSLKDYNDASQIPSWATASVAKAVSAGILKNSNDGCSIRQMKVHQEQKLLL